MSWPRASPLPGSPSLRSRFDSLRLDAQRIAEHEAPQSLGQNKTEQLQLLLQGHLYHGDHFVRNSILFVWVPNVFASMKGRSFWVRNKTEQLQLLL